MRRGLRHEDLGAAGPDHDHPVAAVRFLEGADVGDQLLGQIALGRLGEPADIARAVAFLAGPSAAYITGETLHVNGGMYMP